MPTALPGGSATDIGVKPCNSRVVDSHLRGHLMARFTFWKWSKPFSLCFTRHTCNGCNCTDGVSYTVEGHVTYYLRFSHVMSWDLGKIVVSKKTGSLSVLDCKVYINWVTKAKFLILGEDKARILVHHILNLQWFSFVPWGVTCHPRKNHPNLNQFFCSLYDNPTHSPCGND